MDEVHGNNNSYEKKLAIGLDEVIEDANCSAEALTSHKRHYMQVDRSMHLQWHATINSLKGSKNKIFVRKEQIE